jgi:benzylsuccinate CoA-transferase BbsF subunit
MGQTGPWRDYVGFGPTVQAFSGITWLTSLPGQPPTGPGFSYADHVAGLYASLALLGALEYRWRTGSGQYIDISQVEAMVSLLGGAILDYTAGGKEAVPVGNSSSLAAPHNVYRCQGKDRWCAIAVFTDEEWQGFKRALGNPPWAEDERFATLSGRLNNNEELERQVAGWAKEHTAEEVMSRLQANGVAAGVVQDASDLVGNPQLRARDFFIEIDHPEEGKTLADASPVKLSHTPARYHRAAPTPGQDNNYVYRQLLGMSQAEVVELRENGVI